MVAIGALDNDGKNGWSSGPLKIYEWGDTGWNPLIINIMP